MEIHIPNSAFLGNLDTFLRGMDLSDPHCLTISANQQWFSVHPVVLTLISSLGLGLAKDSIRIETLESKSKHYLQRMGLFHILGLETPFSIVEHEPSGRFIPLTRITTAEEQTQFIINMIPLLHLPPDQGDVIHYVVSELLRNVLEHAQSPGGALVCAQYYAKSHLIRIGISDRGVGIRETIGASHLVRDDHAALQLALTPGITGTTSREGGTESNAGAGLFFIKSIAKVNRDFFVAYSGNACYKLLKRNNTDAIRLHANPLDDRHTFIEGIPYWKGTCIGIDISLDHTPAFHTVLDLIRKVYVSSIRERKKQRHKRPRFVA